MSFLHKLLNVLRTDVALVGRDAKLDTGLPLPPQSAKACFDRATELILQDKFREAIFVVNQGLAFDDLANKGYLLSLRATCQQYLNLFELAIQDSLIAITIFHEQSPSHPQIGSQYFEIAKCYLHLYDYRQADLFADKGTMALQNEYDKKYRLLQYYQLKTKVLKATDENPGLRKALEKLLVNWGNS